MIGDTLTPRQLRRAWRRDLVGSALHEVAHATVIRAHGGRAHVKVWPNPGATANPWGEKFWLGRCYYMEELFGRPRRLLGLAGELAAYLHDDPDLPPGEAWEYLTGDAHTHSDTDTAAMDGHTEQDVEDTLDLLREHWPEVRQEAAAVIRWARSEFSFEATP